MSESETVARKMNYIDVYCKRCKSSMHITCRLSGKPDRELLNGVIMKCSKYKRVITFMKLTEDMVPSQVNSEGKWYR